MLTATSRNDQPLLNSTIGLDVDDITNSAEILVLIPHSVGKELYL